MNDIVIESNWTVLFFTHEMKSESLHVISAAPSVYTDSHHCHLIFCSLKKPFITSNIALPAEFTFIQLQKKKISSKILYHLELTYTPLMSFIWNTLHLPTEEQIVLSALFSPQLDQPHLLTFLQFCTASSEQRIALICEATLLLNIAGAISIA